MPINTGKNNKVDSLNNSSKATNNYIYILYASRNFAII